MKNIKNISLLVLLLLSVITSCTDEPEAGDSFLAIIPVDGNTSNGLPGDSVDINLQVRANEGLFSLTADGVALSIDVDQQVDEVSFRYGIAESAVLGDEFSIEFVLTDDMEDSRVYNHTVIVGINAGSFEEISSVDLGPSEGAAEIVAYSPSDTLLFVVNNDDITNSNRIDVIDFRDPSDPKVIQVLPLGAYGAAANSVAVYDTLLAVAVEADVKQDDGTVLIYNIRDLETDPTEITVGALPDMLTFSPNGEYIVVANEGEPNDEYTVDPEGTISVISVDGGFAVSTATFTAFNGDVAELAEDGFRVFGPGATLAQDVEPEFVTISADSETAYITLQENNGVAVVDLSTATVTDILPLGFKDYTEEDNIIDVTDEDDMYSPVDTLDVTPLFGVYQPDAIASFVISGTEYLITANEGDSRDYDGFSNEERIGNIDLDASIFTAPNFQADSVFGRLKIMQDLGDTDNDGEYEALYSYGARSFSIWNAETGIQVFDSGNDLDIQANMAGIYADGRSDDKSIEPESVVVGEVGGSLLAFIGLERVDAVAVYDISNPSTPSFIKMIETGDAPEGLVFIPVEESPIMIPLLVVSSEDDGTVRTYTLF